MYNELAVIYLDECGGKQVIYFTEKESALLFASSLLNLIAVMDRKNYNLVGDMLIY